MYGITGRFIQVGERELLLVERIVNLDVVPLLEEHYVMEAMPEAPIKEGIFVTTLLDTNTLEYVYLEQPRELTPEERLAQWERDKIVMQEQIDTLTILVLEQGGALVG